MANLMKEPCSRFLGGRIFFFNARKIICPGNNTDNDLFDISQKFSQFLKRIDRAWSGEWRWCRNPKCHNSFFLESWKIKLQAQNNKIGIFCSYYCSNIIFPRRRKVLKREGNSNNKKNNGTNRNKIIPSSEFSGPILHYRKIVCPLRKILNQCYEFCFLKCVKECDRYPDNVCLGCPCVKWGVS